MSEKLVDPFNMFAEVCHTRKYEKKQAKIFCHREGSLFLKKLVLVFLGPEEMIK